MNPCPQQNIEHYQVLSLLGDGGQAKVYLCSDNDRLVAIKVYDQGYSKKEAFKKEVEFMSLFDCSNLLSMIGSKVDGLVRLEGVEECTRPIVVLELAQRGQLYDYICNIGAFSHQICRFLVKKLLNAIEYMHQKRVTHRDLKLENILFDVNFDLKVSDFGLSTPLSGQEGDGLLNSRVGTEGYRPPEMEKGKYTGQQSDIFAIGVILFILYAGTPPFLSTKTTDKVYKRVREERFDSFWNLHEKKKDDGFYSDSFKKLMNSFFNADPAKRPTFESLREDQWLNGEECTAEEAKSVLKTRFESLLEEDEKKRKTNQIICKFQEQQIPIEGVADKMDD